MKKRHIKQIDKLSELYEFASLVRTPVHDDFDIIKFSELRNGSKRMLPPHRRFFFTIVFFEDQKSGQINVNGESHQSLTNAVLFQGKEHIFSFVRDENVKGFILLFNSVFLLPQVNEIEFKYPFFPCLTKTYFI